MQSSQWLKGGPFFEVSFLVELKENKKQTIQGIIDRLSTLTNRVEIVDENVDEMIDSFDRGYPFDMEAPQSIILHSIELRGYVHLSRKRKALLCFEVVSPDSLLVDICFYGAKDDVPEWNQLGIKSEESADFTDFLKELYRVYKFKVGTISMLGSILELFGCEELYPNNCYRYENLSPDFFLSERIPLISIIWNEKYKRLRDIPYKYHRFEEDGILIELGSFVEWY